MADQIPGILVRVADCLRFVPAHLVREVVCCTPVSPVPGTPIGMALVGGQVVSVIELGEVTGQLLLCEVNGEPVAFGGLDAVAAGLYPPSGDGVWFDGKRVEELDVLGEVRRVEQQLWLRRGQEGDDL